MGILEQIANPQTVNVNSYYQGVAQRQAREGEAQRQRAVGLTMEAQALGNERSKELLDVLRQTKATTIQKTNALAKYDMENAKRDQNYARKQDIVNDLTGAVSQEEWSERIQQHWQKVAPNINFDEYEKLYLQPHGLDREFDPKAIVEVEDSYIQDAKQRKEEFGKVQDHMRARELIMLKGAYAALGGNAPRKGEVAIMFDALQSYLKEGNEEGAALQQQKINEYFRSSEVMTRKREVEAMDKHLGVVFEGIRTLDEEGLAMAGDTEKVRFDMSSYVRMRDEYEALASKKGIAQATLDIKRLWKEVRHEAFEPTRLIPGGEHPSWLASTWPFGNDGIYYRKRKADELKDYDNTSDTNPQNPFNTYTLPESDLIELGRVIGQMENP